jgi:hypothetical protein
MTVAPPVSTYVTLGGVGVDTMMAELDRWAEQVLADAMHSVPDDVIAHTVQGRGHAGPEIVKELKTAASSEATALGNKLTAEVEQSIKDVVTEIKNGNTDYQALFKREIEELIKSMTSSAQASAQRLQVGIEDALERVLAEAGIKVDMPLQLPAGLTPEQYANSVAQQVLPQLEQMLRQHVNVKR